MQIGGFNPPDMVSVKAPGSNLATLWLCLDEHFGTAHPVLWHLHNNIAGGTARYSNIFKQENY